MITLEKLTQELKIENIDEIVGGFTITTRGGTSGQGGNTWTTDTSGKKGEGGYQI